MDLTIFGQIAYTYSLIMMTVGIIELGRTIPAILKEGNLHNGLIDYRRYFLISGLAIFLVGIVVILLLSARFVIPKGIYQPFGLTMLMLFSTGYLIICFAKRKQYTFNFSDRSKAVHKEIEKREEADARDEKEALAKSQKKG